MGDIEDIEDVKDIKDLYKTLTKVNYTSLPLGELNYQNY